MKHFTMGNGDVYRVTGVDSETGIPFLAFTKVGPSGDPSSININQLPEDSIIVSFLSPKNITNMIAELQPLLKYLEDIEDQDKLEESEEL